MMRRYRSYAKHKLASGETFVIGYADTETAERMTSASADVSVVVNPEPSSTDGVIVKIPYSRIREHSRVAAPDQDGFTGTLLPASDMVG